MKRILLKGVTWNHSHAFPPLVAAAQRFGEQHHLVRIVWEKRRLHEFGHAPMADLLQVFDLLVIDHPMIGDAAGVLVNLRPLLQPGVWEDMRGDITGPYFYSYLYHDALYALPIDAAAPAASSLADLLAASGLPLPRQWGNMEYLVRQGLVRIAGFSANLFLNFRAMCVSCGSSVAASLDHLFDSTTALEPRRIPAGRSLHNRYSLHRLHVAFTSTETRKAARILSIFLTIRSYR